MNAPERLVVVSTNAGYAAPAAVAVRSALDTASEGVSAVLFYFGLTSDVELQKLRDTFRADEVHIELLAWDMFSRWPSQLYFGNDAVYARLALGRLLDNSIRRVVYLDADTLVLSDVSELWTSPLDGAAFGAVREMHGPVMSHSGGLQNWESAGVPQDAPYCNSGVLALDLDVWRDEELESRCFAFLERFGEAVRFPDQDALNATLWNRWLEFDQAYNVSGFWDDPEYPVAEYGDVLGRMRLFHFQGPTKPWHDDYPVLSRKRRYEQVLATTAWGDRVRV